MTGQTQATAGEQAMFGPEPVLTLGGREYRLCKLGLDAMVPLARIVEMALARGIIADPAELEDGSKGPRLMIFAVAHCTEEVFNLASQLLGVPEEELHDPERFSLADMMAVIGAVRQSRDVAAFLPAGPGTAAEAPPAEPSPSAESST